MKLFFRKSGSGPALIILHGLLGSSDNWFTLAKKFAEHFTVYLLDQRNHGQSPHSNEMDYTLLANDLNAFLEQHHLEKALLIGHSMGGKTVMNFAVAHPQKVEKLVVVDIAPKYYKVHHQKIMEALRAIPLNTIQSRGEAEEILTNYIGEADMRQFLLKNLSRTAEDGFAWKMNLTALEAHLEEIGHDLKFEGSYGGPTLFIRGAKSDYVKDEDRDRIKTLFPKSTLVTLETGHWVQAERPNEFGEIVLNFLKQLA